MMFKIFVFLVCSLSVFFSTTDVRADIEFLQPFIFLGENLSEYKGLLEQIEGTKQEVEQLKSQVSSTVNSVKSTVKSAKERAESIVQKAHDIANAVKEGDVKGIVSSLEFSGLNGVFDGTKSQYEAEEAIKDVMVRKSGDNSIETQKVLSEAINTKQGINMSNLYAEALVERKNIMAEKDEPRNPESVNEAIGLANEQELYSIARIRKMAKYDAMYEEYLLTKGIENIAADGEANE